jgi:hypothetical protein
MVNNGEYEFSLVQHVVLQVDEPCDGRHSLSKLWPTSRWNTARRSLSDLVILLHLVGSPLAICGLEDCQLSEMRCVEGRHGKETIRRKFKTD